MPWNIWNIFIIKSVQFSPSVVSDSLWPHGMQASLSITNFQSLLKLMSIEPVMPSNHLIFPSPPAFNLSQHQGLFQWVSSSHQVAEVLELHLQHQSFQWIVRTDFLQDWLVWSRLIFLWWKITSKSITGLWKNWEICLSQVAKFPEWMRKSIWH